MFITKNGIKESADQGAFSLVLACCFSVGETQAAEMNCRLGLKALNSKAFLSVTEN